MIFHKSDPVQHVFYPSGTQKAMFGYYNDNSYNLYKSYKDSQNEWRTARIRFRMMMLDDDGSKVFRIQTYETITSSKKNLNIFEGCPNTKFKFTSDGLVMQQISHPLPYGNPLENAKNGHYNKETAVAIWKELVSSGWSDCFEFAEKDINFIYSIINYVKQKKPE